MTIAAIGILSPLAASPYLAGLRGLTYLGYGCIMVVERG